MECLSVDGWETEIRTLVRDFAKSPRIARFPIRMCPGDLTDYSSVENAVSGCRVVFHCAYGNRGTNEERHMVNVEGTRNIARACLKCDVERLVHVSTVTVYGQTPDGDLDETRPREPTGDPYGDSKLEAEEILLRMHGEEGLPVTIVQPTVIYGPYAPSWTLNPIRKLQNDKVILINGGSGLCNAVYVDDVVRAMLLAAGTDGAAGQAFLVSGSEPVLSSTEARA